MRSSVSVVAAVTAVLTGCGGGQDYDSPRALADALAEAGLACGEFQEAPVVTGSEATASCFTSDGRDIGLKVHEVAEHASTMVASADLILAGTNRRAVVHAVRGSSTSMMTARLARCETPSAAKSRRWPKVGKPIGAAVATRR